MRQALLGGAYEAHSVIASAQRSVNLFSEPIPENLGEPAKGTDYPTPGLRLLGTIGTGPIRGIRQATGGNTYVVSGSGVYSVNATTWAATHLGDITAGLRTPVSMADNTLDMVIVDGSANGWTVNLASNTFAQIVNGGETLNPYTTTGTDPIVAHTARYTAFIPTVDGFVTSATVSLGTANAGHLKCALFSAGLGSVLGSATTMVNPAAGVNTLIFTTPIAVARGGEYWLGFDTDMSGGTWNRGSTTPGAESATPYVDFPIAAPHPTPASPLVCTLTTQTDPDHVFAGADRVDYVDTYLLFNKPGTPQFYISGSLAVTFDPLDFANKASYSDLLMTLIVAKREAWLIGERTTEVWYNAGATDIAAGSFPFAEVQSVFVDHGTVAKYSVANYDNGVFWLTRDRQGQGFVVMGAGYQTKRVSTYAIEAEIAGYTRIDDAIGFCYQHSGHTFYVITFPHADHTWVYDITTGLWHEWLWIDVNGEEHRHRANCCWPVGSTLVVGDWQNGNLYALDNRVFTDNGRPIKRVRSFPHILADGKRVFYRQFLADFDTGDLMPAPVTTTEEKIITWLPLIAQLNGISVGTTNVGGPIIDWERGILYMLGQTGYQKYTTALETQTPLVTVALSGPRSVYGGDIDPLSGDLILQTTTPGLPSLNGTPISKIDPNTFAVLDTFGISTSFPSYPTSVWAGQSIVCVVCNGVSFGFIKYTVFSGVVAGFRVDTMEHSGFYADIVAGSTDNRGFMIAGKSGGSAASVFLSWDATTTIAPAVPLYRIDVTASATAYDPATWPATNPGITWTTVGTVPVAAVDPTWTGFTVYSLGYDLADGNVLMAVGTQNQAQGYHILKLNKDTAAVMWNLATGTATIDLGGSRINGTLWFFQNPGAAAGPTTSYRIDTLTGTMTAQTISGVFAGANTSRQQTDSDTTTMFYGGTFNAVSNSPIPVEGTSPFTSGWGWMGGQTIRTIVSSAEFHDNLISLEFSDDRGHSYGNPISQNIGATGAYKTSLQWNRLGMCRDRVWRLSWSVPGKYSLQGCWVTATPSDS